MSSTRTDLFPRKSFIVAVILHVLMVLFLLKMITQTTQTEDKPPSAQAIPAFVYTGAIQPITLPTPSQQAVSVPQQHSTTAGIAKPTHTNKPALAVSPKWKKLSVATLWGGSTTPVMQSSMQALRQQQVARVMNRVKDPEPVLLVGDPNTEASPLIKLMARALATHFRYPKVEGNFGIRGKVLVQLTFHPDGHFSDPQIVQSSDNTDFDIAAIYSVNKAPRVIGANRYLSAPKSYVVGFIFD